VKLNVAEIGTVLQIGDGIARVHGLEKAMFGELLEFPHKLLGVVFNLERESVGCVLLGESSNI